MIEKEYCGNCRFWRNEVCKRFPPAMVYDAANDTILAYHGETKEHGWCGEWTELKPLSEQKMDDTRNT